MSRRRIAGLALLLFLLVGNVRADAVLTVDAEEATVGQRVGVEIRLVFPAGAAFEPPRLGPEIGPFTVLEGDWMGPGEGESPTWVWSGDVAAYRTGEQELPALRFRAGDVELSTEPATVAVTSVLDEESAEGELPEIADIKPPLGIDPNFRPLMAAAALLVLFLVLAGTAWWLQRRYGSRLAAVAAPEDPFHRVPPHEWVYAELQKLLAQHLAEKGQVDRFYSELSRILKRYLSGRYRLELMEQTTDEVPLCLRQSAAPERAVDTVAAVLRDADRVKFAAERPGASAWKTSVEQVYQIVDQTKPAESAAEAEAD